MTPADRCREEIASIEAQLRAGEEPVERLVAGLRDQATELRLVENDNGNGLTSYGAFLESKRPISLKFGRAVLDAETHPALFPFQRDLVRWSVRKGRAAIFADTGLGKTPMQIEWCRLLGGRALIVAPLSVSRQTVRIAAELLGIDVNRAEEPEEIRDGINITNYERIGRFDPSLFDAVVLDESSILKSLGGKTRKKLNEMFGATKYRLC